MPEQGAAAQVMRGSGSGERQPAVTAIVAGSRRAQEGWARSDVAERVQFVRRLRHELVERVDELAASVKGRFRRSLAETLSAEILPLAEACRFLEEHAEALLRPRRERRKPPLWLAGTRLEIQRRPWGVVLVISPGNYPLFLPGVQALQALVAGNSVLIKPAPEGEAAAAALSGLVRAAGLPDGLLQVLGTPPEEAEAAIAEGVDKVLFTGSSTTGRTVLRRLAESLTPATLELSGCDAVFVHPEAQLDSVARAIAFGLRFNSGATCISPRRVFVPASRLQELEDCLVKALAGSPPIDADLRTARRMSSLVREAVDAGARLVVGSVDPSPTVEVAVVSEPPLWCGLLQADIFAPLVSLIPVADLGQALAIDARCPYALGASVFGPQGEARVWAERIGAGVVLINDLIVPTADPRLPFGGTGESGYGVTRGPEGLLELTRPRVVAIRRGRWRPHYEPLSEGDESLFRGVLTACHGGSWRSRLRGLGELLDSVMHRARRSNKRV